jgi:hypothetical protein
VPPPSSSPTNPRPELPRGSRHATESLSHALRLNAGRRWLPGAEELTFLTRAQEPALPRPSMMAVTISAAARRRLRPGPRSCPDGSPAAAASPGGSQAWREGSHRSSRMSAATPCWASSSRAMASAVAAAFAVAAYKKTPVFATVTETSSPARLRSRSQTESEKTCFPEAGWPQAIRLTRHSSSTLQAYDKRILQDLATMRRVPADVQNFMTCAQFPHVPAHRDTVESRRYLSVQALLRSAGFPTPDVLPMSAR